MAFTLQVIRGSTTYTIADPFFLEGAEGLGGASVRNIEESGPYQDGATHLDERLDARTITLKLNVIGSSAAVLDGHRDTLMKMFKPVSGVPITLKITRDDNSVRQIDTRRTGPLDIPLVAINRPGNLHRAVVQLRAADPTWYDPTLKTENFLVPTSDWWLAYASIGTANVLEHVENPTQGQAWTNTGSVAAGSPFTVAFRTSGTMPPTDTYDYYAYETLGADNTFFVASIAGGSSRYISKTNSANQLSNASLLTLGSVSNVFVVSNGGTTVVYNNNVAMGTVVGATIPIPNAAGGTSFWRRSSNLNVDDTNWPPAIPKAAAYNIALSDDQRAALNDAMTQGTLQGSAFSGNIAYAGDFDSYPTITMTGPIISPLITNTTTGDQLSFAGGTIGSTDVWTIETRYGRKSVLNAAGSSVEQYLSSDSDLATFRLVADPAATGGTNTISVAGTAGGTATAISLAYYNRYTGF